MMKNMMMAMMISVVMALMITVMVTMVITLVIAMVTTWRSGKVAAQRPFSQELFHPTNLNKLVPTFRIIGPHQRFRFLS